MSKIWPLGQIQIAVSVLRVVFMVFRWFLKIKKENISRHIKIIWNPNFYVYKSSSLGTWWGTLLCVRPMAAFAMQSWGIMSETKWPTKLRIVIIWPLFIPDPSILDFICLLITASYKPSSPCLNRLMVCYHFDNANAHSRRVARSRSSWHTKLSYSGHGCSRGCQCSRHLKCSTPEGVPMHARNLLCFLERGHFSTAHGEANQKYLEGILGMAVKLWAMRMNSPDSLAFKGM